LNNLFASLIRNSENFSLVAEPSLALTVFRLVPKPESVGQPVLGLESLNDINRLLHGRISARDDIMLTQTSLNGIFCIRFATGATRTTEVHVRAAYDVLCKEAESTLKTWAQTHRDSLVSVSTTRRALSPLQVVRAAPSRFSSVALPDALGSLTDPSCQFRMTNQYGPVSSKSLGVRGKARL